jgi:hypothetical protein
LERHTAPATNRRQRFRLESPRSQVAIQNNERKNLYFQHSHVCTYFSLTLVRSTKRRLLCSVYEMHQTRLRRAFLLGLHRGACLRFESHRCMGYLKFKLAATISRKSDWTPGNYKRLPYINQFVLNLHAGVGPVLRGCCFTPKDYNQLIQNWPCLHPNGRKEVGAG